MEIRRPLVPFLAARFFIAARIAEHLRNHFAAVDHLLLRVQIVHLFAQSRQEARVAAYQVRIREARPRPG